LDALEMFTRLSNSGGITVEALGQSAPQPAQVMSYLAALAGFWMTSY